MTQPDPNQTFRQEAFELLDSLEEILLDLEQATEADNRDLVDSAFRAMHTLKGSGAMFGFDEVAEFVHDFETAFDKVRKGEAPISQGLIAIALSAKDHILRLIEEPGQHAAQGEPILQALREIIGTGGGGTGAVHNADTGASGGPEGTTTWNVRFSLPEDALAYGTNPLLLLEELRSFGTCEVMALADLVPPLDQIDPEISYLSWDVQLTTDRGREAIEDVFLFIRDGMELEITPVEEVQEAARGDSDAQETPTAVAASASGGTEKAGSSLRVPAERLDELMDRVGELVIAQARLTQIASASDDVNLKAVAEELERLASGLRDTTMGIRMVPIGTLFSRFRRLVHDLSSDLGKEIDFLTSGEETELDKTVIERLADPLVHIIRNSIDHGLETPGQRMETGKSAKGTVQLSAVHSGAEVAISISDDGAGLDAKRIRARAIEAGLISADAEIVDQELYQFLFHPGFSTAKEVTSVSGRGVGMDVVKRVIEALRGSIDITSKQGEGTTVTLRLPLTLAIVDSMLVRVGQGRYTIPLQAVEECVELPTGTDSEGRGRNFLSIRGSLVPFLRLRELFKTQAPPDLHQKVVIVSSGEFRVGLVVDQIIGNNQTVIKSLSKLHADIQTFSGGTILGDGTVALILDVGHLVSFGQNFEDQLRGEAMGRVA